MSYKAQYFLAVLISVALVIVGGVTSGNPFGLSERGLAALGIGLSVLGLLQGLLPRLTLTPEGRQQVLVSASQGNLPSDVASKLASQAAQATHAAQAATPTPMTSASHESDAERKSA